MTTNSYLTISNNRQDQAYQYLVQGDYYQATSFYQQAIDVEPNTKLYYWYLGLTLLLQGQENEAQATWLLAMMEDEPEKVDSLSSELANFLSTHAQRFFAEANYASTYLLRQHIQQIQPTNIPNLLHLINIAIELEIFCGDNICSWELVEVLNLYQPEEIEINLLMQSLQRILDYEPLHPSSLEFAKACLPHLGNLYKYFAVLLVTAVKIAHSYGVPAQAIEFAKLCMQINSQDTELLKHLASFYQISGNHIKAIETAKYCYSLLENDSLVDKVYGNHLVLKTLINTGGYWDESQTYLQKQKLLLNLLIEQQPNIDDKAKISRLLLSGFFFAYFQDNPQQYREIQNQLAALCESNLQKYALKKTDWYEHRNQLIPKNYSEHRRRLKVGYISSCFRQHSVGWLARWLFEHHNREAFELYGYFVSYQERDEPLQEWYTKQFEIVHKLGIDSIKIAETICKDEIDILIDLDSLTVDVTCEVMALKPAKVQATWLGWDASGIPAVDYYIADPYVLPDDAQDYYSEKIWRLPQSYIAVDGFEVGVPTLRREDLNIPSDAIVYLSSQGGCKRHPDTVKLQMKVLKAVPNSYLLIKGLADAEAIQSFFTEIANEEGVDCERLRFLPMVSSEAVHRANLTIADVVLDTFPYNGATTTLETLWMGIPLVTKVGKQFAARNSYTMMRNVGITEGIAWTDEEYVKWGIRLGKDEALRQQIAWKLRQSRQTAPLWNAKQFTCEMEKAYKQMWQSYIEK